jgi:hypothetical protein
MLNKPKRKKKMVRRSPAGSGGKVTYFPPLWRFNDLITGLGQEKLIVEKLVARGYPRVPVTSIVGWRLRKSIPPFWVPVFIQMGLDEQIINRIEDLRVHY